MGAKGDQGNPSQSLALAVDTSNVKYRFIFPISNHSGTPKLFPYGNNGAAIAPRIFPGGSVVKNPAINAGDGGSIPGPRISPGGGNGNPLQCSCLGNPMDRGIWWAKVHGIARVIRDLVTKQQQTALRPPFPPFASQLALQNSKET